MKEMVYSCERKTPEVIARDSFKGYEFCVINYGTHPCAYVAIAEGQPYYWAKSYEDVDVDCHGGFTFMNWGYAGVFSSDYCVIGWDYAHCGDYTGSLIITGDKKWTTKEIVQECEEVIDQLYVLEHEELLYV